jgi:hypothetical protein
MSKEHLLASLSVPELEQLMQRAIDQCLDEPQPTPDAAAVLGRVAAEIRFELWLRDQQGRRVEALDRMHRRSRSSEAGARTH